MDPNKLFKEIFAKYNFSDQEINTLVGNFAPVLFLEIIKNSKSMNDAEVQQAKGLLEDKNFTEIVQMMKAKYTEDEWNKFTFDTAQPLLEDYVQSVKK